MLKRHLTFFSLIHMLIDICFLAGIWIGTYFIRFKSNLFAIPKGIPPLDRHLILTTPIVGLCFLTCLWCGFYKPKRIMRLDTKFVDVFKAVIISGLLVLAFLYYLQDTPFSRKLLVIFLVTSFIGYLASHFLVITIMQYLHKNGYNLRYYVVVGAGQNGQKLVKDIGQIRWLGLKCAFFVDNDPEIIGNELLGIPVYGPFDKLPELVKKKP